MAIWIVKNKRKTDNPITAEAVCGFAMFPQCELKGDHFTWTLDLEFAGPKPALLEEAAPAVKYLQKLWFSVLIINKNRKMPQN
jgi:hypothetical protein